MQNSISKYKLAEEYRKLKNINDNLLMGNALKAHLRIQNDNLIDAIEEKYQGVRVIFDTYENAQLQRDNEISFRIGEYVNFFV